MLIMKMMVRHDKIYKDYDDDDDIHYDDGDYEDDDGKTMKIARYNRDYSRWKCETREVG